MWPGKGKGKDDNKKARATKARLKAMTQETAEAMAEEAARAQEQQGNFAESEMDEPGSSSDSGQIGLSYHLDSQARESQAADSQNNFIRLPASAGESNEDKISGVWKSRMLGAARPSGSVENTPFGQRQVQSHSERMRQEAQHESMVNLVDHMFDYFQNLAYDFNQVNPVPELELSWIRPSISKENISSWHQSANFISVFSGRISTRYWTLVVRGTFEGIHSYIIPADKLLSFSTQPSSYVCALALLPAFDGSQVRYSSQDYMLDNDSLDNCFRALLESLIDVAQSNEAPRSHLDLVSLGVAAQGDAYYDGVYRGQGYVYGAAAEQEIDYSARYKQQMAQGSNNSGQFNSPNIAAPQVAASSTFSSPSSSSSSSSSSSESDDDWKPVSRAGRSSSQSLPNSLNAMPNSLNSMPNSSAGLPPSNPKGFSAEALFQSQATGPSIIQQQAQENRQSQDNSKWNAVEPSGKPNSPSQTNTNVQQQQWQMAFKQESAFKQDSSFKLDSFQSGSHQAQTGSHQAQSGSHQTQSGLNQAAPMSNQASPAPNIPQTSSSPQSPVLPSGAPQFMPPSPPSSYESQSQPQLNRPDFEFLKPEPPAAPANFAKPEEPLAKPELLSQKSQEISTKQEEISTKQEESQGKPSFAQSLARSLSANKAPEADAAVEKLSADKASLEEAASVSSEISSPLAAPPPALSGAEVSAKPFSFKAEVTSLLESFDKEMEAIAARGSEAFAKRDLKGAESMIKLAEEISQMKELIASFLEDNKENFS
ncbi:MAG: hypothetical protein LCH63_04345 [Candidatus Melainabacteria bacterium]|nr:hypothetical protein [Candidatus Melainabacteria bacterium]